MLARGLAMAVLPLLATVTAGPARAADMSLLERLATCSEAWTDWRDQPERRAAFGDFFRSRFTEQDRSPAWTPKQPLTVFGLPVRLAYPESVGMGVGFSLEVDADHETVRRVVEAAVGQPMRCQRGDGSMDCEREIAPRKTVFTMTALGGRGRQSLIGCFYVYRP